LYYVITPKLSILFTVHTNGIVVTIRVSIGDLIVGVGVATKTFAPGGKHPRVVTGYRTPFCLFRTLALRSSSMALSETLLRIFLTSHWHCKHVVKVQF